MKDVKELKNKISDWWRNLKYLQRIEILLEIYPDLGIFSIERQGMNTLWGYLTIERQKLIMEMWEKEHKKERS